MKPKWILATIFTIILLGFFSVGLFQVYRWARLFSYEETEGIVIGKNLKKAFVSQSGVGEFVPEIYYSFSVNGMEYKGNKFILQYISKKNEAKHGLKRWAQSILDEYEVGDKVLLYYNPSNPKECVLSRKLGWLVLLPVIFPALLLILFFKFAFPNIP